MSKNTEKVMPFSAVASDSHVMDPTFLLSGTKLNTAKYENTVLQPPFPGHVGNGIGYTVAKFCRRTQSKFKHSGSWSQSLVKLVWFMMA